MSYQIDVVSLGRSNVPTIEINWMDLSNLEQWEPIVFNMVVIRGNGLTAVINTGPSRVSDELNQFWKSVHPKHALYIDEIERPEAALGRLGVHPQDIDYVFLTPLTAYTSGNLDLFANAKIGISRKGWIDYLAPEAYVQRMPDHIYVPREIKAYLLGDAFDRIVLLEDEETEIVPGIRSFFVGSHQRSSMAYVIETNKGKVVVSDCFFKYRNIEQNIPLGINESMEETLKGYEKIRKIASLILPLYDPEVYDRHPDGIVEVGIKHD